MEIHLSLHTHFSRIELPRFCVNVVTSSMENATDDHLPSSFTAGQYMCHSLVTAWVCTTPKDHRKHAQKLIFSQSIATLSSISWMGTVTKSFTLLQNQQLKWLSGTWTWETQSCVCLQFIFLITYVDLGIKVQLLGSFPVFHDTLQNPGYKTGQVDFLCWLYVLPKGSLSKRRERSIRCLKLSQLWKSILCLD